MYFLDEVVNLRESRDKKRILVSFMEYGRVQVKRFFVDKFDLGNNHVVDAVYSEKDGRREVEETINMIRLKREYPNLNEEGVKKLYLYLTAQFYAAIMAKERRAVLIDRTHGLNDLPHVSEHFKKREERYKFWMKRKSKVCTASVK